MRQPQARFRRLKEEQTIFGHRTCRRSVPLSLGTFVRWVQTHTGASGHSLTDSLIGQAWAWWVTHCVLAGGMEAKYHSFLWTLCPHSTVAGQPQGHCNHLTLILPIPMRVEDEGFLGGRRGREGEYRQGQLAKERVKRWTTHPDRWRGNKKNDHGWVEVLRPWNMLCYYNRHRLENTNST